MLPACGVDSCDRSTVLCEAQFGDFDRGLRPEFQISHAVLSPGMCASAHLVIFRTYERSPQTRELLPASRPMVRRSIRYRNGEAPNLWGIDVRGDRVKCRPGYIRLGRFAFAALETSGLNRPHILNS